MREQTQELDPLLVRANALGIIDIVLGSKWTLNIEKTILDGLFTLLKHSDVPINHKKLMQPLINIIKINFKDNLIRKGHKFYIIDGIMEDADFDLYDIYNRVKAMTAITESSDNDFLRFIILLNDYEKEYLNTDKDYEFTAEIIEWQELYEKKQYNDFFQSVEEFRKKNETTIKMILSKEIDHNESYDNIIIPLNRMIRSIYDIDAVFIPD